ncbi:hypothetical protein C5167_019459 [Papaver somniferum]|uniref:Uncharacterized protein n=1 Tax=Papaver somniferum TaxID=3469 RepID=A0A4Y7ITC7_PAPSO|nr:hypothetical protein C5167_019459 [Papaver somniferum]
MNLKKRKHLWLLNPKSSSTHFSVNGCISLAERCFLLMTKYHRKPVDSTLGLSGPLGNPTTSVATRKNVLKTVAAAALV